MRLGTGLETSELLAAIAAGESFAVEFKGEESRSLNDRDLVEAVVCLANGAGGQLIIGVEDDQRVTGARPRHGSETDPSRVQALIANLTTPPVRTSVAVHQVQGKPVLVIEVENSQTVVGTTSGKYIRRAVRLDGSPQCVPYFAHEMLAQEIDRGAIDFASITMPGISWDDLDPLEFERFRSLVRRAGAAADAALVNLSDADILRALGVLDRAAMNPVPTMGALLLFGRADSLARFAPNHEVAFQVLRGSAVEANDFIQGPLFRVAEELMQKVQARNPEQELQLGLLRIALPLVPQAAVREAIANALVHRDYTRVGAVRVQFTDDALEITSPGGFPAGVRLDNLLDASQPRSRILADSFKRAGMVERTGRGINRMFESMLRVGRDAPDFTKSTDVSVTAVLPTGIADIALARFVLEREQGQGRPMRLSDLQILHELRRETSLSAHETTQLLHQTESQSRSTLGRMLEEGLVEARGTGRGRRYHLAAAVYRAIDEQSAYVRIRSFDAIQQEQMVLTYVRAHGQITRREAKELCALGPEQASQLLRRMASSGALAMRGQRRGSHYVAADLGTSAASITEIP